MSKRLGIKENNEEQKVLEIQTSDFCKNNMQEEETEYEEKLKLKLQHEENINEIVISDISTSITKKEAVTSEETESIIEKEQNIFYKTTKINKTELMNVIGTNGSLEIKYKQLQEDDKVENDNENVTVLPEVEQSKKDNLITLPEIEKESEQVAGQIIAENGKVVISSETAADENNYITVIYPENVNSIEIRIYAETNKIDELNIVHNKIIRQVENVEDVDQLETGKTIYVSAGKEILNTQETISKSIEYTKTVAELGIDKMQISTAVANKVNFTVTMHTENEKIYDLYKNPYFIIELPSAVKTVNLDSLTILNNPYFTIQELDEGTLENGHKVVYIKLEGNQTEYTKSIEENTQIVFETTIEANDLIPTTEEIVILHYQNENVKTYDGVGVQANGNMEIPLTFVSNKEVIVETKAIIGEEVISSPKTNYNTVVIKPNTYQNVGIIGMAINNTGEDIRVAKILGSATNVGEISGVDARVYYTQNENATIDLTNPENGWSAEYIQNAKKYLIIVENFAQAQTVNFGYYMNLPENAETDINHEVQFEVYDDNNQVINVSKTTIYQEAERFDTYTNEKIKAEMITTPSEGLEIGDFANCTINISNVSGEDLEDILLNIDIPEGLRVSSREVMVNGNISNLNVLELENKLTVQSFTLAKDQTTTITLNMEVMENSQQIETITANINYGDKQTEIFNKLNMVKASQIQTTITSNKEGKLLEENEEIEYKVTLKNIGKSHAEVYISIPYLDNINIIKAEAINTTTGQTKGMSAVHLSGTIATMDINPNEIVEIYIKGIVKELSKDAVSTMYAEIGGKRIQDTTTEKISNSIKRSYKKEQTNNEAQTLASNSISGIAWIDKNENGQKDENETLLKGVQAVLIDTKTAKVVSTQTTNNNGEYSFNNVEEGSYIIEFKYNTNTLNVTEYKSRAVPEDLDSDVISTTQNNKTTAKTEVITLSEGKTENVNAGFVLNKNFDMSINKGITKVTVNNEQGTNTYQFNNSSMAKVEIDGEYLKGSTILVEYEIAVTNTGEVDGYAKLISDKIPEGMKFNSELNTDWYEGNDGKLYSVALASKKLQPGETAVIKLVLTKEMEDDKIATTVNTSKIEETYNESLIPDKKEENNSSEATIIISLTTGQAPSYIWLVLIVITIIGIGIFGVKKIAKEKKTQ